MNENDLRDHLRVALDPVGGLPPAVRDLRAAAHRRARSSRMAAGALSLVVLAGAGVGIAAAAGGHRAASVRPASTVHVSCRTQQISLLVGQTFELDCTPEQLAATVGESVVPLTGSIRPAEMPGTYRAVAAGEDSVTVGASCPSNVICPARPPAPVIAVAVYAADGSVVIAPCRAGTVALRVGQRLAFTGCPIEQGLGDADRAGVVVAGDSLPPDSPPGTAVHEGQPVSDTTYLAVGPGTATVTLVTLPCTFSTNSVCRLDPVGPIVVTVTGSTTTRAPVLTSTPPPATTSPAYDANDPSTWKVSVEGYGPLRIGMTAQQVKAIVGSTYAAQSVTSTCSQVTSSRLPQVVLQVEGGVFTATYVGTTADPTGGPSTVGGIHLGQSEADAAKALGPSATASQYVSDASTTEYDLTTSDGKATVLAKDGKVIGYSEGRTAGGEFACL